MGMTTRIVNRRLLWACLSLLLAITSFPSLAKSYPPLGRVTVLMAQDRLRGQDFKSLAEREQATLAAAQAILNDRVRELEEMKAGGERTDYEYEIIDQRITQARGELKERVHRMIKPGGPVNVIKRGYGAVKRGVGTAVRETLRPITGKEAAEKISKLVVSAAELKSRAGQRITATIHEMETTEKAVKTSVAELVSLVRQFERNPKLHPVERAAQLRDKCINTCDAIHAECQHRNCRSNPKDRNCMRLCASCPAGLCEQAFSPAWAEIDRSFVSCTGSLVVAHLNGMQECVDQYIEDNGSKRVLNQAKCLRPIRSDFNDGRDRCRQVSCQKNCGERYSVYLGQCICAAEGDDAVTEKRE
jgi:hypothetical protein